MKRIIADCGWGNMIIEDTDTNEFSFQCMCGGIGMYWRRVVLTTDEIAEFREGAFDADRMVYEVCRETDRVVDRLVPSYLPQDLVRPHRR
jgi:hypothetical protein